MIRDNQPIQTSEARIFPRQGGWGRPAEQESSEYSPSSFQRGGGEWKQMSLQDLLDRLQDQPYWNHRHRPWSGDLETSPWQSPDQRWVAQPVYGSPADRDVVAQPVYGSPVDREIVAQPVYGSPANREIVLQPVYGAPNRPEPVAQMVYGSPFS